MNVVVIDFVGLRWTSLDFVGLRWTSLDFLTLLGILDLIRLLEPFHDPIKLNTQIK